MKNVQIFTSHHKAGTFLADKIFTPIHVGAANSLSTIGCQGDDSGDNISYKNPFYCELTAQYWVWKQGQLADYVGFMHYRRHLNFSEQNFPENRYGVVDNVQIDAEYQEQFGLNHAAVSACLENYDLLLPRKWSVTQVGNANNYLHYQDSPHLHITDYQAALEVVTELYPEYREAITQFNQSSEGYYTNIFVMKRELFMAYSEWLFTILEALEPRLQLTNYSAQEQRVVGHIAERLFNIYIIHLLEHSPVRYKELQRTFVTNDSFTTSLVPAFSQPSVPVVISFDDNYSVAGAALINSIIRHSSSDRYYDLVVLEDNVSKLNKQRLLDRVAELPNFILRFFAVSNFGEMKGVHTRAHFSPATYARLFIPQLFCQYDRVLFIDSDTVVKADVSELLETDIQDNLVAAVQDIVMEGFVHFGTMSESSDGVMPALDYLTNTLNMSRPQEYFQAGLVLFNVKQMREENTFTKLMTAMKEKNYWFLDQDIMNKVFFGRVHFLPMEWNTYHGNGNTQDFYPHLNFATYMRFLRARQAPKMIHYAGENKPWNTAKVDFYDDFMANVQGTQWESEVYLRHAGLYRVTCDTPSMPRASVLTKLKGRLMPLINRYAPKGSPRRNQITKIYYLVRTHPLVMKCLEKI